MVSRGYMVKLFSVTEMQLVEKEANQKGLTYEMMMDNAGRGIADIIENAYSHLSNKKVFALVGSGNNGGDALVALYYLSTYNWDVTAYIVRHRPETDPLISRVINNKGLVIYGDSDFEFNKLIGLVDLNPILIDGVLGTGIKLPLQDDISQILSAVKSHINKTDRMPIIVAVDCPSGIDCDTGEVANQTLTADITVTMAGMKTGLIKIPSSQLYRECSDCKYWFD